MYWHGAPDSKCPGKYEPPTNYGWKVIEDEAIKFVRSSGGLGRARLIGAPLPHPFHKVDPATSELWVNPIPLRAVEFRSAIAGGHEVLVDPNAVIEVVPTDDPRGVTGVRLGSMPAGLLFVMGTRDRVINRLVLGKIRMDKTRPFPWPTELPGLPVDLGLPIESFDIGAASIPPLTVTGKVSIQPLPPGTKIVGFPKIGRPGE